MVFQNYALFPHMTVYENLAFPLRVRKVEKNEIDKKVDKALSMVSLNGFETPTNGEIYLDGKAISSIPPHKRGIGMVFQNYALFPHMTVYENLAFPLRVRKIPKDEADKKIDKALSMVSLQGFASRMPGQLSGGQQQKNLQVFHKAHPDLKAVELFHH